MLVQRRRGGGLSGTCLTMPLPGCKTNFTFSFSDGTKNVNLRLGPAHTHTHTEFSQLVSVGARGGGENKHTVVGESDDVRHLSVDGTLGVGFQSKGENLGFEGDVGLFQVGQRHWPADRSCPCCPENVLFYLFIQMEFLKRRENGWCVC